MGLRITKGRIRRRRIGFEGSQVLVVEGFFGVGHGRISAGDASALGGASDLHSATASWDDNQTSSNPHCRQPFETNEKHHYRSFADYFRAL